MTRNLEDELIAAALIEDPNDTDEDKEARKSAIDRDKAEQANASGTDDDSSSDEQDDDTAADSGDKKPAVKPASDEDDGEKSEKDADKDDDKPADDNTDDKPDDLTDAEKQEQERQTRKEKREQRKQEFLAKLKPKPQQPLPQPEAYTPLDLKDGEEYKTEDLRTDREKATQVALQTGQLQERQKAEQEKFWQKVELESQMLGANPDLKFMDPGTTEKPNPDYNEKRAASINKLYFDMIGYQEHPLYDPTTKQPLIDPATNAQAVRATVQRTDLSYKDFVEGYVDTMEDWAEDNAADTSVRIASQRSKQGIRPGGGSHSKKKVKLEPGVTKDMTDEEFDEFDKDSDDEILAAFAK